MLEDLELSMKILVLGNGMVGKTSLSQRFVKNIFTNQYKKTLGVDFLIKKKYIKSIDKDVEFMIWDTAGQECYDAITTRYYKGASGALIVFSVTDKDSFKAVKKWRDKIRAECDSIPLVLIMNKIDVIDDAVISDKEAMDLAVELKVSLVKVSVKDNVMVNEAFENLAIEFYKKGKMGFIKLGLHINCNGIEDVNNIARKSQPENKLVRQDYTKEINVINKPISEGFNLKADKNKSVNQNKLKKKKKFCSIL